MQQLISQQIDGCEEDAQVAGRYMTTAPAHSA
jgi:hypothetical protein